MLAQACEWLKDSCGARLSERGGWGVQGGQAGSGDRVGNGEAGALETGVSGN